MPDFPTMYTALFNKITDVIADLQEIQQLTEEMYISAAPKLTVLDLDKPEETKDSV